MRIIRLMLKNFKGCKHFVFEPGGQDCRVHGDNGTHKTTLFDSFLWLLFGKDSQNRADFAIKTLGKNGEPINHLDHEVEGVFEIDGNQIELRKVYREKWTKRRGSATEEFTGHETDHFIDGVPVKKSEYTAKVAEIADEDVFKLLTSPTYFNEQLHWQDRRRILLEVCGDVSDDEVIASSKQLSKLPDILGKRSLEEHRKVIAARRKEINKELDRIPVRIDEVSQGLPDISSIDAESLEDDLAKLKEQKKAKESELARVSNGGDLGDKLKQIRVIESELMELENGHKKSIQAKTGPIQAEIDGIVAKVKELKSDLNGWQREVNTYDKDISVITEKMAKLREEWTTEAEKEFAPPEVEDTCPTCGQLMPKEKVEDAIETARAEFNRIKADNLENIARRGQDMKEDLESCQQAKAKRVGVIDAAESEIDELTSKRASLQEQLDKLSASMSDCRQDKAYLSKLRKKQKLEEAIKDLEANSAPEIERITTEIEELDQAIAAAEEHKAKLRRYEEGRERIKQLEAEEKKLAAEFNKLEEELFLTEEFIRSKVNLLEEKINSKFDMARFKLFDEQINGGIVEVCETTYNGVPYSGGLNNAARINVGLDIINTLADHYGFAPPIFVDNAEAVTKLIPVKGQLISLIVSEKDKTLRVEGPDSGAGADKAQPRLFEEAV